MLPLYTECVDPTTRLSFNVPDTSTFAPRQRICNFSCMTRPGLRDTGRHAGASIPGPSGSPGGPCTRRTGCGYGAQLRYSIHVTLSCRDPTPVSLSGCALRRAPVANCRSPAGAPHRAAPNRNTSSVFRRFRNRFNVKRRSSRSFRSQRHARPAAHSARNMQTRFLAAIAANDWD